MYCLFFLSISSFRSKMRTKNFSLVCLWQLYPSLFFQCSRLSPPRLNSSRNLQKRKPGWWKAKFGMAKSEFQWRICSCVCLLQRFYYARQNWMENWCSAVGFWHFSFFVTREVSNSDAQLCWWLLWRSGPADLRSHPSPSSPYGKQPHHLE